VSPEKLPNNVLWHQSGVNAKGEPFVQLIKGTEIFAQMDVNQAREHAQAVLESAEAAEQDAFIMKFMQEKVGLDRNRAGQVLIDFRRYRAETTGKKGGPTSMRDWVMPRPDATERDSVRSEGEPLDFAEGNKE
jgi:hypothetical protein